MTCLALVALIFTILARSSADDGAKPVTDSMQGRSAGQARNDNGIKKFVWCPSGKFKMGCPKAESGQGNQADQVEVQLSDGFWLGKYEVTQSEWTRVMGSEPWRNKDFAAKGDGFPATYVSWDDSVAFCRELTERERKAGRLPDGWE